MMRKLIALSTLISWGAYLCATSETIHFLGCSALLCLTSVATRFY